MTKDISEWEIINFAEYFIAMYEDLTVKPFNGQINGLLNDIDILYRWNEGKRNHHQVVKDYINLFFERCKSDPKLSPNSALLANSKNCEILDSMYMLREKRKNIEQPSHSPNDNPSSTYNRKLSSKEMLDRMLGGS